MKVRYNSAALVDLDEIFAYIAADNHSAAAELVGHIQHVVLLIGLNPQMGHRTKRPNLKKFPVEEHLIVYEITPDEIIIQYVRHGARKQRRKE